MTLALLSAVRAVCVVPGMALWGRFRPGAFYIFCDGSRAGLFEIFSAPALTSHPFYFTQSPPLLFWAQLQKDIITTQDSQLDEISAVLKRQKQIGIAINQELEEQARLLVLLFEDGCRGGGRE